MFARRITILIRNRRIWLITDKTFYISADNWVACLLQHARNRRTKKDAEHPWDGWTEWQRDGKVSGWTVDKHTGRESRRVVHLIRIICAGHNDTAPRGQQQQPSYSCESNSRIVRAVDVWLITTDRALDPHTAPLIDQTNQEEYGDQRRCKLSPERLGARQTTLPATRAVNDERLLMLGIILACWNWPDVRVRSIRKHIRKVCRRNCQMQTYV